jgi:glycosyltransferase involved in cell wall biosynthesis
MKILFQSRVDIFARRGGDTVQMEKTKEYLEKTYDDIKIDINPVIVDKNIENYDLVHLFNLDWICETYPQAIWAKKHDKPLILSAIHHSEKEVLRYENEARYDIRRLFNFIVPSQQIRDISKNLYRSFTFKEKFNPTFKQILQGFRNQQRKILKMADIVLVQTDREYEDIKEDFNCGEIKYAKVVNGVDADIFTNATDTKFKEYVKEKFNKDIGSIVVCAGRIEPRKNQINLIKAFLELVNNGELKHWNLIIFGEFNKKHVEYSYYIKQYLKNDNILHLGQQPQNILASAFKCNGVFANPSWFETTGLSALEAAASGMVPVVSGDRIKEYLLNDGVYCDPGDITSIKNAILKASKKGRLSTKTTEELRAKYNWEETAKQTYEVYRSVLN